jgi:hypothetical protein
VIRFSIHFPWQRFQKRAICLLFLALFISKSSAQLGVPPIIAVPPLDQTVQSGGTASFTVIVISLTAVQYRWFHNGSVIPGAIGPTYTISGVQWTNAGAYAVEVRNAVGKVTSPDATLTVINPPLHFDSAAVTANGFTMQLSGPILSSYVVLASSNLTHWTPVSTNFALLGQVTVTDTAAASHRERFYKAFVVGATTVLQQNTSGGDKSDIGQGTKVAQSFRYGTIGGPNYTVSKIVLHLSRESQAPNANLSVTIGTGVNSGAIAGSSVAITPSSISNTSGGNSFQTYEITYNPLVGPLTSGTTYYLNLECEASNGRRFYCEVSESDNYLNGSFYEDGNAEDEDMWFQVWGGH